MMISVVFTKHCLLAKGFLTFETGMKIFLMFDSRFYPQTTGMMTKHFLGGAFNVLSGIWHFILA